MSQWIHIAFRNVWRNRRRSFFLAGTVAIGTMALLLFVAYISATAEGLRESIVRGGTGHLQIGKVGHFDGYEEQQLQLGLAPDDKTRIHAALSADPRVRRVVPRLSFGGLISNGQRTLTFHGTGVQPDRERQAFGVFQNILSGDALAASGEKAYSAVLGQEMARRLGVKPGDSVTVMTSTVSGGINAIDLQVSGIVGTGNPESDLFVLQTTLTAAQDLLQTDKISRLVVLLENTVDTDAVQVELTRKLGGLAEVRAWQQLMPLFDQVLSMYRNQFIVFGIIIVIIIFLGVSTMTSTNIFERGREIGTMRAIGISARTVRFLFTVEGLLQGAVGAAAGCVIALACSWLVSVMEVTLPPPPGRNVGVLLRLLWLPEYTTMIMIVLPVIAMCAAFIISRRIAHMAVVQALSDQH